MMNPAIHARSQFTKLIDSLNRVISASRAPAGSLSASPTRDEGPGADAFTWTTKRLGNSPRTLWIDAGETTAEPREPNDSQLTRAPETVERFGFGWIIDCELRGYVSER